MRRHINRTVERPQFREFQRDVAHAMLIDDWEFLDGYTDDYFREAGYGDVWIMYMRGPYRTLKIHGRKNGGMMTKITISYKKKVEMLTALKGMHMKAVDKALEDYLEAVAKLARTVTRLEVLKMATRDPTT